jgi:hypothetical protein
LIQTICAASATPITAEKQQWKTQEPGKRRGRPKSLRIALAPTARTHAHSFAAKDFLPFSEF